MGRHEAYRALRAGIAHRHPRRRDAAIERYGLPRSRRHQIGANCTPSVLRMSITATRFPIYNPSTSWS